MLSIEGLLHRPTTRQLALAGGVLAASLLGTFAVESTRGINMQSPTPEPHHTPVVQISGIMVKTGYKPPFAAEISLEQAKQDLTDLGEDTEGKTPAEISKELQDAANRNPLSVALVARIPVCGGKTVRVVDIVNKFNISGNAAEVQKKYDDTYCPNQPNQ